MNFFDAGCLQAVQQRFGDLVIGVGDDLAAILIHHIFRNHASNHEFFGYIQLGYACLFHFADMAHRDALVLGDNDLAGFAQYIEARDIAAQTLRHHFELNAFLAQVKCVELKEHLEHVFVAIAQRAQQDGDRHLATAIDTEVYVVLCVELEVQPGTAIRNDARGKQQLAGGMRFAAIMLEEHPGRTVQLGNDHALGAVDHKRTGMGHKRDFAHVHFLLFNFFDCGLGRFLVHDGQTHAGAQRRSIGQTALTAFLHVERRHAQLVADKIQTRILGMAENRENPVESSLQAIILALFRRSISLQKCGKRFQLRGQQKRNRQRADSLGKTFTDAFFFGKRVAHIISTIEKRQGAESLTDLLAADFSKRQKADKDVPVSLSTAQYLT